MSNSSLQEFIHAAAIVLVADRPDLWPTMEEATEDISHAFSEAHGLDDDEECVLHFSGFTLTRTLVDDTVYYTLSKKLVALGIEDSGNALTFDWTQHSVAFDDVDLMLPDDDELDIEPNIIDDLLYEDEEDTDI